MTTLEGVKILKEPTREKWGGFIAAYESPDGTKFSVLEEWNAPTETGKEKEKEKEKPNGICHLEIPCEKLERAEHFYGEVFGWTFQRHGDDYSLYKTHDLKYPLAGGLFKRKKDDEKISMPIVHILVEDIPKALDKVKAKGGTIVKEKFSIGEGIGFNAHFSDTEGNLMALYTCP